MIAARGIAATPHPAPPAPLFPKQRHHPPPGLRMGETENRSSCPAPVRAAHGSEKNRSAGSISAVSRNRSLLRRPRTRPATPRTKISGVARPQLRAQEFHDKAAVRCPLGYAAELKNKRLPLMRGLPQKIGQEDQHGQHAAGPGPYRRQPGAAHLRWPPATAAHPRPGTGRNISTAGPAPPSPPPPATSVRLCCLASLARQNRKPADVTMEACPVWPPAFPPRSSR